MTLKRKSRAWGLENTPSCPAATRSGCDAPCSVGGLQSLLINMQRGPQVKAGCCDCGVS